MTHGGAAFFSSVASLVSSNVFSNLGIEGGAVVAHTEAPSARTIRVNGCSASREDVVRVTVKALGDSSSQLHDLLEPGKPAGMGGPHGRFDHWRGGDRQVWIAGGVGVAPFLRWLRALEVSDSGHVDDGRSRV
jgi:hypothetical protein